MKRTFPLSCTKHANKSTSNYFKGLCVLSGIKFIARNKKGFQELWALSVWRAETPLILQTDAQELQ